MATPIANRPAEATSRAVTTMRRPVVVIGAHLSSTAGGTGGFDKSRHLRTRGRLSLSEPNRALGIRDDRSNATRGMGDGSGSRRGRPLRGGRRLRPPPHHEVGRHSPPSLLLDVFPEAQVLTASL